MSTTPRPRTSTVTLWDGDDLAKIEELRQAAHEAAQAANGPRLMHEADDAQKAAEAHDKFVTAAKKRATKVTLQALGRRRWRSLVAEHPPRDGHEGDKAIGVNDETFGDALVPLSIVDPKHPIPADMDAFLDSLCDADFQRLYGVAFALNRAQGVDPKASLVSELTRRNDETSK